MQYIQQGKWVHLLFLILRKLLQGAPRGYPILCLGPHLGHLLPVNSTQVKGEGGEFDWSDYLVFTLTHIEVGRKGPQNKTDHRHTEEGRVSVRPPRNKP